MTSFEIREKTDLIQPQPVDSFQKEVVKPCVAVNCSLNLLNASCWWLTPRLTRAFHLLANCFLFDFNTPTRFHQLHNSEDHFCTPKMVHFSVVPDFLFQRTFSSFIMFSSVQFSRSVMSDSLRPHESQHARPPCPSPTRGVHSDSRPSSQWFNLKANKVEKFLEEHN